MYSVETLNAWTDHDDPDGTEKPKIQERHPPLGKLPFIKQRRGPVTGWRLFFDSESDNFNIGIGWVIVGNAIVLGLETDFGHAHFELFEHFFLFVFVLEMFARIAQLGLDYFKDPWYICLDFPLVVSGCLDLWILPLCRGDSSGETTAYQFSVLRLLRMLRLLRVLRLIRIFRMFHHLQLIVKAFSKAIHVVILIGLIVVILIYSLSIVFTQLVGQTSDKFGHDKDKVQLYFGCVGSSMMTLFNVMFANDWDELEEVLTQVYPTGLVLAIFAGYTVITISLVSLIIGLISESLLFAQEDFKQRKLASYDKKKKLLATKFSATISEKVGDSNGFVKGADLKSVFTDDMLGDLTDVGVSLNVSQLQNVIDSMVKNNEQISIDLFIEKLTHLSGDSQASAVVDIKYEVLKNRQALEEFTEKVAQLETKIK
mmetsp:Transcript_63895/g.101288  ORF Transcript_63895/g.101288 Transcript_63895/m.101288 type:complete len:427 (-) Transcript_63895:95-1375(-)|eukprot:CAMPEP_0169107352 /NCGR_PEP_ID=MMETSP1015-20121227/24838_1 /TAXON_ID=342587 /ORGANISM="Karlodinium micrum, Strain CCMP2283" /LENGTH=426 /DNA_ID=CAMNT_0009168881 /DNA_START=219 /DNA_END=1499 /DNA_ORIENTATION=-